MLNFPLSRKDLSFWDNITAMGSDINLIRDNTTLDQFNLVYDGVSLFHYFSENVDIIEMIHDKYKMADDNGILKAN